MNCVNNNVVCKVFVCFLLKWQRQQVCSTQLLTVLAAYASHQQVGSSGGFQPPPFPPPTAMPQFQPPSAPIPPHLRTAADDSDDDENTADNDAAVRRTVAQDATGPPGMDGMDEMMDLAMPHGMGMHARPRPMPGGAGAGGAGAGGDDEDATERAFLEAAMKESLGTLFHS